MAWERLLLEVISACRAASHAQRQASSTEGFGCKPASAAKCVILKNRNEKECLASGDLRSAGSLGLPTQGLRAGESVQLPVLKRQKLSQKGQQSFLKGITKIFYYYYYLFMVYYYVPYSPWLLRHFWFMFHSLLTNSFLQLTPRNPQIYFSLFLGFF